MKTLLYILLPAALLAAGLFLAWEGLQPPPPEAAARTEEPPRYAVGGAHWVRLGVQGEPEFRAQAEAIDYYADGSAKLRNIELDALGGYDSPWQIRAPQGEVPPRSRRLLLEGGVRASGEHASGVPVSFATEQLWVDLLRRELRTDARVELQTDFRTATARGLRADFDGEHVQLLNDVQVDYAPEG
jgi:LPS export ABC transporter protein LptC